MVAPVFGAGGKPLFLDSGGGVLVPAVATDPCDCCDEDTIDCAQCEGNVAADQVTVVLTGITSGVAGVDNSCHDLNDCEAWNDTYVLDYDAAASGGPNGCWWKYEFGTPVCRNGLFLSCAFVVKVQVLNDKIAIWKRYKTANQVDAVCDDATPLLSDFKAYEKTQDPIDCVDGNYTLDTVLGDSACRYASTTASVTFG